MKRTLSALTALLICTAHAQDIDLAGNGTVWRVAIVLTPERNLTLDVPDGQCQSGTIGGLNFHGRWEPDKDVKLCAGEIDGLPTLTGFVMPSHLQLTQLVRETKPNTGPQKSFSLGIDGSKAVL